MEAILTTIGQGLFIVFMIAFLYAAGKVVYNMIKQ